MTATDTFDAPVIIRTARRHSGSGAWVSGRIHGHRFEALVFRCHADNPDWELGQSCISKMWLQRLADHRTVFNWDRSVDVAAANEKVQNIVDFLAAGLAEHVEAGIL